jgi:tetratricopeptide (TPR) repeat protein
MGFWQRTCVITCAIGLASALGGCEASSQSAADNERDPHYILGQNRAKAKDFQGAVEAFEAALEANPHSAMAHYQLAMLYEDEAADPAAAIYHYQQYLKYDPKAGNAAYITERVRNCKLQLAKDVAGQPVTPAAMQQLQDLAEKNRQLQAEVDRWQAYYFSQSTAVKTNLPAAPGEPASPASASAMPAKPAIPPRTHTVAAGENPAAIARKLGLNLEALLAANPGLDPRKLRVGQVISLPPP